MRCSVRLTESRAFASVTDDLVEIVAAQRPFRPIACQSGAIVSLLLFDEFLWMFRVPILFELVLSMVAMAMETVAARRAMEDLPSAVLASMVALTSPFLSIRPAKALTRNWGRRLYIACIGEHRHIPPDVRNAMFVNLRSGAWALGR